jgi:hypothetical protein
MELPHLNSTPCAKVDIIIIIIIIIIGSTALGGSWPPLEVS